MSNNQKSYPTGTPSWVKAAVAIGGLAIVGGVAYYAVTNVFGAGVNAYKDMFTQQYNALLKKMDNYTKQNGSSGFTPTQQLAIAEEEKILALTEQGLANASNGLNNTIITITEIAVAGAVAVGISAAIIKGWFNRTGQKAYTGHGVSYIAARSLADKIAMEGNTIQATNIISSLNTMFQTVDRQVMQQTISSLQASLVNLTGVQFLTAQQMISQFQIEIRAIPVWIAAPLPI